MSIFLRFSIERMPETAIRLSIMPKVRYSRLLPVLSAANPMKKVKAKKNSPSFVGRVLIRFCVLNENTLDLKMEEITVKFLKYDKLIYVTII